MVYLDWKGFKDGTLPPVPSFFTGFLVLPCWLNKFQQWFIDWTEIKDKKTGDKIEREKDWEKRRYLKLN
jgi:hypothetical protein